MINNASSSTKETELLNGTAKVADEVSNDSNELIAKYNHIINEFRAESIVERGELPSTESVGTKTISQKVSLNEECLKIMSRTSFPERFPSYMDKEQSLANMVVQGDTESLIPVAKTNGNMAEAFIQYWNKRSALGHQVTEEEAGYIPCRVQTLFHRPESYLKKAYCQKIRYRGQGQRLLPADNYFSKISLKSSAHYEVQTILDYYSNDLNQFILIPIEFSSRLSRCTRQSVDIGQESQTCNKVPYVCQLRDLDRHPIFTITYKDSILQEVLPCVSVSLIDNLPVERLTVQSQSLQMGFFNRQFLSYFLHRSDFWIDDFYCRCWHFSRYFCDKLDLGCRTNFEQTLLSKDSLFQYLLACSAQICVAVKYWVLNPAGATYFRCWCGEKIFDALQEKEMLNKMPVGTAELYNFQQEIRVHEVYHKSHGPLRHICVCNRHFSDHQLWLAHILSTNIYDIHKICPVFLYTFSRNSTHGNRFVCQCKETFSDYDFWSFLLHVCDCSVLRGVLQTQCTCMPNSPFHKAHVQMTNLKERKRSRSSVTRECLPEQFDSSDDNQSELEDPSDPIWEPSDRSVLPLKVSCMGTMRLRNRRVKNN